MTPMSVDSWMPSVFQLLKLYSVASTVAFLAVILWSLLTWLHSTNIRDSER